MNQAIIASVPMGPIQMPSYIQFFFLLFPFFPILRVTFDDI